MIYYACDWMIPSPSDGISQISNQRCRTREEYITNLKRAHFFLYFKSIIFLCSDGIYRQIKLRSSKQYICESDSEHCRFSKVVWIVVISPDVVAEGIDCGRL